MTSQQQRNVAVCYYSPLRKAVDGVWVSDMQQCPISWDEDSVRAKRPSLACALAAARLRLLACLPRAPPALSALLQVASTEWRDMLTLDIVHIKSALGSAVESLPAPTASLQPRLDVASQFPTQ